MNDIGQRNDFAGEITIKADNLILACGKYFAVVLGTDHMGKWKSTSLWKYNCVVYT